MSKARLIKRLEWYYPTERFHTYVTFPGLLIWLLIGNPFRNLIFLSYGLIVCIVILYQGQLYWKLKLNRLKGIAIDQEKNIRFFKKSKQLNQILILLMIPIFVFQLYFQNWNLQYNDMLGWGILANIFAILEHVNYYHTQLMIDNKYDFAYLQKNKKLKTASLAKDLMDGEI